MGTCRCNGTLANTGKPGCDSIANITQRHIVVQLLASDGTRNRILGTDIAAGNIDATYVNAKLNNTDPTERWYPLPLLKNIADERGDAVTEEFEDGSVMKIKDGTRTHTSVIVGEGPHYLLKLKEFSCVDFGIYEIDSDGAIIGQNEYDETNDLYPIPVEKGSWDPKLVKKTDTTFPKIGINFQYRQDAKDEWLEKLPADQISGINMLAINGLFDVHLVLVGAAPGQTSFTADFKTDFGPINDRTGVTGLLSANFYAPDLVTANNIYNVTDALNVAIVSVTESTSIPGRYTFTYASQTVGDVLRVYPKKDGYSFIEIYDTDHDLAPIV